MEDLLSGSFHLPNDDVNQTELDEWLHTITDVFEQDFERPAQEVTTTPSVQRPKRRDSFDCLGDDVFGIDFSTALRAADPSLTQVPHTNTRKAGAELASSDLDKTHHSRVSSVTSFCSKSLSSISPRPVIDLTANEPINEPTIIDLTTTDTLPQPPIPFKRARKVFDSNIVNIEQMLTLMGKPSSSSLAATDTEAGGCNLLERTKSCPPTRRFSVGSTDIIHNNWRKKSPRRIRLPGPEPMPPACKHSLSPTSSFFRDMDEHSSRLHRMISSCSTVSHVGDDMNSMNDSKMSTRSHFNELQGAMAQTQQSRRMIIGALSDSERSDGNIDVASSAHVATAAAVKIKNDVGSSAYVAASAVKNIPEFVQPGLGRVTSIPKPVRNSSNATRATNDEMTEADANVERYLEIAREKMILEMRLAEMYRGVGSIQPMT